MGQIYDKRGHNSYQYNPKQIDRAQGVGKDCFQISVMAIFHCQKFKQRAIFSYIKENVMKVYDIKA